MRCCTLLLLLVVVAPIPAETPPPLKILFLGDRGHHRPADRFRQLQAALAPRGIDVTYTEQADALKDRTLSRYDGLIVYANIDAITPEQEAGLLDFVASGKGFIPLHCASYCFRNSEKYVELVGAQFQRHDTGTFRTQTAAPEHPIMKGYGGFESWDETYTHTKHNDRDRTVLEYRLEGRRREPWTWVRTHGKGRVFYTAWGHDQRTFGHAGFHNLIERGLRWACGQDPSVVASYSDRIAMRPLAKNAAPFEYVPANVPFYPKSDRWGVSGENIKKMQKPLSSAGSMTHITTPVDFELKLFVDETKLGGKPLCMNWDERGRLWVALTYDYPNELQSEGKGRDRIVICEDTNGDGTCDSVTSFADKLSIPTSLLRYRDGVIVTQAPHTLFLRDTDGDGVCDKRDILFTGWGTQDTHAGPSNLRYGLDNWIYGMVGYSGYRGTVGGEQHRFSQGFFRFKPDGSKLEFLRSTSNNSWGVGISEEGHLFGSTANGCPSVFMPIPNRYYESVKGWSSTVLQNIAPDNHFEPITEKVRQVDWHGGFTAAAGSAIYTARSYPRNYWNSVQLVCEPTGHLVAMFKLTPEGASYRASYWGNLVASDDEWCSPIMAEVGPDGNVWVLDWYNFIVQHNPTPPGFRTGRGNAYETDLRDRKHGRIYRVVPVKSAPQSTPRLDAATPEQLVQRLADSNQFWRLTAQRLLVERGNNDVAAALATLIETAPTDAIGLCPGAVHGLATAEALGLTGGPAALSERTIPAALKHRSASVRQAAARALPATAAGALALRQANLLRDADTQVRLAAFVAAARMPADADLGRELAALAADPIVLSDRWLADGLTAAGAAHAAPFLERVVLAKELSPRALDVVGAIAEHMARSQGPMSQLLAGFSNANPKIAETILTRAARTWPRDGTIELTDQAESAMAQVFSRLTPSGQGALLRLATAWGSKKFAAQAVELTKGMLATVTDPDKSDADRIAAVRQMVEIAAPDEAMIKQMLDQITPQSSPALNAGILESLSATPTAATIIIKRMTGWSPGTRSAAVRSLLGRVDATRTLLAALDAGEVPLAELSLEQRTALAAHTDRRIAARARVILNRGGSLPNPDRQKVLDEMMPLTKKPGDPVRGKIVYKNNCAKCHVHGNEGTAIGPNLSGVAVHTKEHLLTDILDPSRNVEGNFRIYRVEKSDGQSLSGLLVSETRTTIELVDVEAKKHVLQRADIEELQVSNKSLMPEGFEKQIKPDELTDLLAFLAQRGKYLPIPLDKVATVVTTKGMFFAETGQAERLDFRDWSPKTFKDVPFVLVDPQQGRTPNAIMLYGPQGQRAPSMPRRVKLPCNSPVKAIHMLSGISGWGWPASTKGTVSMIVRLHYDDGQTEDHSLINGEHFADYIRNVEVPASEHAFEMRGRQQVRYLSITPKREAAIREIELVKGPDTTAPVVMAVTIEPR